MRDRLGEMFRGANLPAETAGYPLRVRVPARGKARGRRTVPSDAGMGL